jgi:UDP-2,3-diacylglucosamine pyrophosphatase LpxH
MKCVISDLHLGATNCLADDLLSFLQQPFEELILAGDTIDRPNQQILGPKHWPVVGRLRELASTGKLTVVSGNHDRWAGPSNPEGTTRCLEAILNAPVLAEYVWETPHGRFLVRHGDGFDRSLNLTFAGDVADVVYRQVQKLKLLWPHWDLAYYLKLASKKLCRVYDMVRVGMALAAKEKNCVGAIAGHTHAAEEVSVGGVPVYNSGSWTDVPGNFILCDETGLHIRNWSG